MRCISRSTRLISVLVTVGTLLPLNQVFAAGFEKSVFWDAHYSAIGGAAQSSVEGPQALYWNPAGLAGIQGLQINGDFSPTWSKFSGPFAGANTAVQNSSTGFNPVGAGFIGYGVTPQWGLGIGYYVSAGNKADYDSVNTELPGITYDPNFKGDLTMTELSIGTGYELIPGLKIGAAYRVMFVSGELAVASSALVAPNNYLLAGLDMSGISATKWTGFRVGLEWAPKDNPFGFGVVYRNQVRFAASSNASVTEASTNGIAGVTAPAAGTTTSGGNPTVAAALPQRIDAAAHYHFSPNFTGFLGYSFTNYSADGAIGISGVSAPNLQSTNDVQLGWSNMHQVRIGGECTGVQEWPIRLGFVWTSEVTPKGNALPIIASPGKGYSIIAGTGHKIMPDFTIDGAFEYSWDSGSVAASDNPIATTQVGDYSAKAYALHLSATYAF